MDIVWVSSHGSRQLDHPQGVACALDILRRELRTTMAFSGQTNVKNLDRDLVFRVD